MFLKLKQFFCFHEFKLKDLNSTGIPEPEKPKQSVSDYPSFKEARETWKKYWNDYYNGDWIKKRVSWTCHKCNKQFFAHCGLDISPRFGKIVSDK